MCYPEWEEASRLRVKQRWAGGNPRVVSLLDAAVRGDIYGPFDGHLTTVGGFLFLVGVFFSCLVLSLLVVFSPGGRFTWFFFFLSGGLLGADLLPFGCVGFYGLSTSAASQCLLRPFYCCAYYRRGVLLRRLCRSLSIHRALFTLALLFRFVPPHVHSCDFTSNFFIAICFFFTKLVFIEWLTVLNPFSLNIKFLPE